MFLLPFSASGADVYLTYELLSTESAGVQLTGATPVKAYEFAIGYPAARFDIYFQQSPQTRFGGHGWSVPPSRSAFDPDRAHAPEDRD